MEVFWGNPKKTDEQSGMITWPPQKKNKNNNMSPTKGTFFFFCGRWSSNHLPITIFQGHVKLGGGFNFFGFHPYLGKIPVLTNIFQLG